MFSTASDLNLLFGILAVQLDFVSAEKLVAGMNRWVLEKHKPLGEHLVAAGALTADAANLLKALVDKHIEQHGGEAARSLAALNSAEPLTQALSLLSDVDVQTSLAQAGPSMRRGDAPAAEDRHATIEAPQPRQMTARDRFRVLRPLAAGGLGKVSIARDLELNREVALKELLDRHADDPNSRARFLQEAEITGRLEHPGVVPIYGLGQYADGRPFYVMRFIRGDSLAQAIVRFHREASSGWTAPSDQLQLRRLLARMIDVCNAVEYAHSRGVLHRDLKPGNVMLGAYGETLVVDWGLAKPLGKASVTGDRRSDETLDVRAEGDCRPQSGGGSAPTQMGSAVGTPAFMSPEQAAGRLNELGPASDVYGLGATLYVLLTGKPPQEDADLGVVLQRVEQGDFPAPRSVKACVPRALEAICLKAMARHAADRYASPRAMAEDVEAWLADEQVAALPESLASRTRRWVKKHRTLVTSGAAVLLVTSATSSLGVLFLTSANQREREARQSAVAAQTAAEKARAEALRQVGRNDELLGLARQALERYETLSKSPQLNRYGMESLRSDLLEAAIGFYDTLAKQSGESEKVRGDRARALARLGSTYAQLGRIDQATNQFQQALAIFLNLEQEFPASSAYRRDAALANSSLGELLVNGQQSHEAAAPLAAARDRFEKLQQGKDAEPADSTVLAFGWSLEGERLRQLGQMEPAAEALARGIAILREFDATKLSPEAQLDVLFRLARALNQLAALESQALWRFEAARAHFVEAEQIMKGLAQRWPDNTDVGFSLVQITRNSGLLAARENQIDEARERYDRAMVQLTRVEQLAPDVPFYRLEMAELLNAAGQLQHPLSRDPPSDAAVAQLEESTAIGRRLVDQYPQQAENRKALIRHQTSLGGAYHRQGRDDDARQVFIAALDELSKFVEITGASVDTLYTLGTIQYTLGEQLGESGEIETASEILDQSEGRLRQLIELAPRFCEAYLLLSKVYAARSRLREQQGRLVDAAADLERVAATSDDAQRLAEAAWLKSGIMSSAALARISRWVCLVRIRDNGLNPLADAGQYEQLADEALRLPKLTREPADHFVAARALAYAARKAFADKQLAAERRDAHVESLASAAVDELEAAWKAGYLRQTGARTGVWFRSAPSPKTLREANEWQILRRRDDFTTLLERIEAE